jgi:putative ABC transport system permease protein
VTFNILSVAMRNLRRKSFRTFVLVLSIGLLVSILVFGTSFIVSVNASIVRASNRLGADLLVVPIGARDFAEEVLLETKVKQFYMDRSLIERVKKIEGIEEVTYQTYLSTIMGLCCDIPTAKVVIFDQDTDFIVTPWLEKAIGRRLEKNEVIIGSVAYENFDLLDVDRSVFFNVVFNIVGVLGKTGTGLDNAILMSAVNFEDLLANSSLTVKPDQISVIFTKVREGLDPYMVGRTVENEMIEVDVIHRSDMGQKIISNMKDFNRIFAITILLAGVLSVFLAWSVFSAIANERVREIGIMRAIGARNSHISSMFIFEVLTLGVGGSIVGLVFGVYLSFSISSMFQILNEISVSLSVAERVGIGMTGVVTGTGVCLLGALSSIIRLRRLEPLSAIKEV